MTVVDFSPSNIEDEFWVTYECDCKRNYSVLKRTTPTPNVNLSSNSVPVSPDKGIKAKNTVTLNIKMIKCQFCCYGTIAGYDEFCISNIKQAAISYMQGVAEKRAPGQEIKIIDKTIPEQEAGKDEQ